MSSRSSQEKGTRMDLLCTSASSDVAPDTRLGAISVLYQYIEITEHAVHS